MPVMVFSSVFLVFPFGVYIFALNAHIIKYIQSHNLHKSLEEISGNIDTGKRLMAQPFLRKMDFFLFVTASCSGGW